MGAGHSHTTGGDVPLPPRIGRSLVVLAVSAALATVVGMVALWPSGEGARSVRESLQGSFAGPLAADLVDAELEVVEPFTCPGLDPTVGDGVAGGAGGGDDEPDPDSNCVELGLRLLEGPDEGSVVLVEDYDAGRVGYEVGETLVLSYDPNAEPGFQYGVADRQRSSVLLWLAVIFAAAVVVLGRLRGLAALGGLAVSIAILLVFTVPALLEGSSPVAVALVSASAVAFCAIYLAHGVGPMSTVALLGTLGALALTVALSAVFVEAARITLLYDEDVAFLRLGEAAIDLRGLFLAGIIIGTLGALDDMTVTQASAVWELRAADPSLGPRQLYRAGLRIGRDHVASTVNTLVLAYAGASMPLLLLFAVMDQSLVDVVNGELVAAEVVRTLVGSIGLVAAVPLTTWMAAVTVGRAPADEEGECAPASRRSSWSSGRSGRIGDGRPRNRRPERSAEGPTGPWKEPDP